MSVFQCDQCGCRDNTAGGSNYHIRRHNQEWFGIPDGLKLCCACTPSHTLDGRLVDERSGYWSSSFKRLFLPKGEFFTNNQGNLEHRETGLLSSDFIEKYPERISFDRPVD